MSNGPSVQQTRGFLTPTDPRHRASACVHSGGKTSTFVLLSSFFESKAKQLLSSNQLEARVRAGVHVHSPGALLFHVHCPAVGTLWEVYSSHISEIAHRSADGVRANTNDITATQDDT